MCGAASFFYRHAVLGTLASLAPAARIHHNLGAAEPGEPKPHKFPSQARVLFADTFAVLFLVYGFLLFQLLTVALLVRSAAESGWFKCPVFVEH